MARGRREKKKETREEERERERESQTFFLTPSGGGARGHVSHRGNRTRSVHVRVHSPVGIPRDRGCARARTYVRA